MRSKIPIILILLMGLLYNCWPVNPSYAQDEEKKIKIVTTIAPITDAARTIGGDHVLVNGLMGPGVDPHLYKASKSDVTKLTEADIVLYNGLYLEAKMEGMLERLKRDKLTVPAGEAVPVELRLEGINNNGHEDPHIWFDVTLWMMAVDKITQTLAEYDPAHKEEYLKNADEYKKELEMLHGHVSGRAMELSALQRVLVTAHDAFRYFGRKYGFEVLGLQGIGTQAGASAKNITKLAEFIAKRKIKTIFVESSVPERNIKDLQDAVRKRGWEVEIGGQLFSDAMGDAGTPEWTYIGTLTHNIDTIVDSLKK
ncbi:MAG TPA: zinc ABC transporter substrate-binding protein [Candidatus Omnitrophota bacterium]|nr:zinc ABC transporter substrate-binding protein [Candidatus Omnitrophota bacterium]